MTPPVNAMSDDNTAKNLAKVQIMILDSSERAANLIKNLLSNFGFSNVVIANDGYQGVQILRKLNIDLIFTDCDLKVYRNAASFSDDTQELMEVVQISGVDFVRRLRHAPSSPNPYIPIVMLVDQIKPADIFKARDAGVDEIMVKPLNAATFCEHIINIIDSQRIFITAEAYKGPCRRRKSTLPATAAERRTRDIRIIRRSEHARKETRSNE